MEFCSCPTLSSVLCLQDGKSKRRRRCVGSMEWRTSVPWKCEKSKCLRERVCAGYKRYVPAWFVLVQIWKNPQFNCTGVFFLFVFFSDLLSLLGRWSQAMLSGEIWGQLRVLGLEKRYPLMWGIQTSFLPVENRERPVGSTYYVNQSS